MCLKAEKAKLAKENVQLKHYIKQYLTEMALRGGKDRPLSVKIQSGVQKIDTAGKILYVSVFSSRRKCRILEYRICFCVYFNTFHHKLNYI